MGFAVLFPEAWLRSSSPDCVPGNLHGKAVPQAAASSKTVTSGFHPQPSSLAHLFVTGTFSAKEPPGSPDQSRQAMGKGREHSLPGWERAMGGESGEAHGA